MWATTWGQTHANVLDSFLSSAVVGNVFSPGCHTDLDKEAKDHTLANWIETWNTSLWIWLDMTDCLTVGYLPAQKAWVLVPKNKKCMFEMYVDFLQLYASTWCTLGLQWKDYLQKTVHSNAVTSMSMQSTFKLAYLHLANCLILTTAWNTLHYVINMDPRQAVLKWSKLNMPLNMNKYMAILMNTYIHFIQTIFCSVITCVCVTVFTRAVNSNL